MKDCLNKEQNLASCSCSYGSCERKGICCQCVAYHRANNEIPGCFFSKSAEKTFDRSVNNFLRTNV